MSRLYYLPKEGVLIDLDLLAMTLRKDINEYVIVLRGAPNGVVVTGEDHDALIREAGFTPKGAAPVVAAA